MKDTPFFDTLLQEERRGFTLEIVGEIVEIIYKNEMNSYTIAVLQNEQEEITIVGYLPFVNQGDYLKVVGKKVEHPDYGEQIKIETFEKVMPEGLDALEKYLANGTIKGIGPATARKIIQEFGEETIYILKVEPQKLSKIKGISKDKALEISKSFIENWELWQLVGYLDKFGLGAQSAQTVYEKLGEHAIEEIEKNPYILLEVANKVDFMQIDQMALKAGIDKRNIDRIKSGIRYALLRASYNGNCAVLEGNLYFFTKDLLQIEEEYVEDGMIDLKAKEEIVIETREDDGDIQKWVYLSSYYKAEKQIAENILKLKKAENMKYRKTWKKALKEYEKNSEMELSEKQREAVEAINEQNVCIITGGPGTGKTTIIKTVIDLYLADGKKPVLCAPTGRAAKRMTETTGYEAKTLHRLLELGSIETETSTPNMEQDVAPIDADLIIVDEMSMVDVFLMNYLLKAVYPGTKLILVGDIDQLQSVGPGSVLKDLIESGQIETVVLNKVFRQAAQSRIIMNSHEVNEGKTFVGKTYDKDSLEDFFYLAEGSKEKILDNVLSLSKERLKKYGDYDFFKNIQVITPTKKGELGTKELNKSLQEHLNPKENGKKEKTIGAAIFRQGDKVMQVKNNYDIYWEKRNQFGDVENGKGIFNGEFGILTSIDEQAKMIKIRFDDDKVAWYPFNELDQIEHSYAITVHKSQRK